MSNTPSPLPCPFCGAPAHGYAIAPHSHSPAVLRLVPELPDHPGSYVIEGQCACGSGLIGANESEVTARWNRRTPQQDAQSLLTDAQIAEMMRDTWGCASIAPRHALEFARAVLAKGGSPQPVVREPQCWCLTCRPMRVDDPESIRMALCPTCGNKRCPKANNHRNQCSNSNEPGQKGSAYEGCGITQKGGSNGL